MIGTTGLSSLTCTDGAEDAVVDGVVQEQYLGRLNKDGHQRQQAVCHKEVHTGGQHSEDGGHERADDVVAEDGQQHTQNADGEVVDQHLETGGDMAFHLLIELLDDPAGQRAHDHGAHQHGVVRAADAAHHGDGGDDTAAVACNHLAALPCNEDGQQVGQHRGDHAGQLSLGNQPASMNRAVRKPHAMNAPIFGMTMPLRNLPKRETAFFICSSPFHLKGRRCSSCGMGAAACGRLFGGAFVSFWHYSSRYCAGFQW